MKRRDVPQTYIGGRVGESRYRLARVLIGVLGVGGVQELLIRLIDDAAKQYLPADQIELIMCDTRESPQVRIVGGDNPFPSSESEAEQPTQVAEQNSAPRLKNDGERRAA